MCPGFAAFQLVGLYEFDSLNLHGVLAWHDSPDAAHGRTRAGQVNPPEADGYSRKKKGTNHLVLMVCLSKTGRMKMLPCSSTVPPRDMSYPTILVTERNIH